MTSFAFIAGLIPLVVATGVGRLATAPSARRPRGHVTAMVIGVLIIPGLVTCSASSTAAASFSRTSHILHSARFWSATKRAATPTTGPRPVVTSSYVRKTIANLAMTATLWHGPRSRERLVILLIAIYHLHDTDDEIKVNARLCEDAAVATVLRSMRVRKTQRTCSRGSLRTTRMKPFVRSSNLLAACKRRCFGYCWYSCGIPKLHHAQPGPPLPETFQPRHHRGKLGSDSDRRLFQRLLLYKPDSSGTGRQSATANSRPGHPNCEL